MLNATAGVQKMATVRLTRKSLTMCHVTKHIYTLYQKGTYQFDYTNISSADERISLDVN